MLDNIELTAVNLICPVPGCELTIPLSEDTALQSTNYMVLHLLVHLVNNMQPTKCECDCCEKED